MSKRLLLPLLLAIVVASCTDTNPVEPVSLTITDPTRLEDLYDLLPDPSNCSEGTLKASEKQKVLTYLNALRRLHRLEPVEYRSADDPQTAKSALIIVANRKLSHTPDASSACFSDVGSTGAATSNLAYRSGSLPASERFIDQWLVDAGVATLGHRRWLLDPFLKYVSFGRVDASPAGAFSGSAIKVIFSEQKDIASTSTEMVAYPFEEYPARLFPAGTAMSLTVVSDRVSKTQNSRVDFSQATIAMTSESGETIPTAIVLRDNTGFGVPNAISFTATGVVVAKRYDVTVSNVSVAGTTRSFSWTFRLTE